MRRKPKRKIKKENIEQEKNKATQNAMSEESEKPRRRRKSEKLKPNQPGDILLMITMVILVVFGVVMVFSSSYYFAMNKYANPYRFLKREIVWVGIGSVLALITSKLPYWIYKKVSVASLLGSVGLLCLVLTKYGVDINNAKRWIGIPGTSLTIMPGEIAKICAVIFIAWFLSLSKNRAKDSFRGVGPCLLITGIYFGLIMKQPNLSTAVTIAFIIIGMLVVAGMNIAWIVGVFFAGVAGVAAMIKIAPYRLARFTTFLDPFEDPLGSGYQVVQSLLALGSGGVTGLGLGKSVQKALYLPEPQNDFIFAIIGEELGFIGAVLLICVYVFLIWRGINIAINAVDMFGCLMASGITIMLASQVLINIAVATSSMPATGISLPFISWGGNSLAIFMAAMGILYNISKYRRGE